MGAPNNDPAPKMQIVSPLFLKVFQRGNSLRARLNFIKNNQGFGRGYDKTCQNIQRGQYLPGIITPPEELWCNSLVLSKLK
jgi:hypothetical protein